MCPVYILTTWRTSVGYLHTRSLGSQIVSLQKPLLSRMLAQVRYYHLSSWQAQFSSDIYLPPKCLSPQTMSVTRKYNVHQFCLMIWSVYLKQNIVPSGLSNTSANTEKALVVFQTLLMKMRKRLPLPAGVSSWLSACSECSKPWVPTQMSRIMMMGVLMIQTERMTHHCVA